jgi:hypothetical protein
MPPSWRKALRKRRGPISGAVNGNTVISPGMTLRQMDAGGGYLLGGGSGVPGGTMTSGMSGSTSVGGFSSGGLVSTGATQTTPPQDTWHVDALTATAGALIYGNATPAWAALLHPGGTNYVLQPTANSLAWTSTPTVATMTVTGELFALTLNAAGWGPAGEGIHVGYIGGSGGIACYKYTSPAAYLPMTIDALNHIWDVSGVARMTLTGSVLGIDHIAEKTTSHGTVFDSAVQFTGNAGFWNHATAAQPAAVADATDAASVILRLNDLLARLRGVGIIAT